MTEQPLSQAQDDHLVIISTVAEFLKSIERGGDAKTGSFYRGQADTRWRVDCSAVRRLAADPTIDPTLVGHALVAYTADLLSGAERHVGTCPELPRRCSELEVLAQLQHQGAATGLIDFTTEPLVALWFACSGHQTEDGAVYVLSRSEVRDVDELAIRMHGVLKCFYVAGMRDGPPYFWDPRSLRGRPASQASVFILGVPFLWPAQLRKLVISKESKPALLEELRTAHGIAEDTLFGDLAGYAHANSISRPFNTGRITQFWAEQVPERSAGTARRTQAYGDRGLAYVEMGQYEKAVEMFTKAIAADADSFHAYANRAKAKRCLHDYDGALADYSAAIKKTEGIDRQQVALAYWDMGLIRWKLGQEEEGCADMNRAIKMGLKRWHKDEGEGTGRIVGRLEEVSDKYRS